MSFGFNAPAIKAADTKRKQAQIVIHQESKQLADDLMNEGWMKSITKQKLSIAIQKSRDNYDLFSAFVYQLHQQQQDKWDPFALYLEEFWNGQIRATPSFLRQWWNDAREDANKWRKWNGDLERYVFTPDHSDYQFDARSFTFAYCGYPDHWERLLREFRGRKFGAK